MNFNLVFESRSTVKTVSLFSSLLEDSESEPDCIRSTTFWILFDNLILKKIHFYIFATHNAAKSQPLSTPYLLNKRSKRCSSSVNLAISFAVY